MSEEKKDANAPDALALTRMWGSTVIAEITDTAPQDGVTVQFSDVRLPEPLDCTLYFTAERPDAVSGTVIATTLELLIGLGRTNVKRVTTFLGQPSIGVPLVWTVPFQPLVIVQGRVIVQGAKTTSGGDSMKIQFTLQVAPVTRVNYEREALKFGMALPGEAEGFDDAMLEDLEEHDPDAIADIRAAQERAEFEDGGDDVEDDGVSGAAPTTRRRQIVVPPRFERAIERVSAKLGRNATMRDLPPTLRSRLERALRRQP